METKLYENMSAKEKLDYATQRVLQLKKERASLAEIQGATEEYKAAKMAYEMEAAKGLTSPCSPSGRRLAEQARTPSTPKQRMDSAAITVAKLKRENATLEEIRVAVEAYKVARDRYESNQAK